MYGSFPVHTLKAWTFFLTQRFSGIILYGKKTLQFSKKCPYIVKYGHLFYQRISPKFVRKKNDHVWQQNVHTLKVWTFI